MRNHFTFKPKRIRNPSPEAKARERERTRKRMQRLYEEAKIEQEKRDRAVVTRNTEKIVVDPTLGTQAQRLFHAFGGPRHLLRAIHELNPQNPAYAPATIYKWGYPRSRGGTDGIIPTAAWPIIIEAAKLEGIVLDETIFFPGKKDET